MKKIISIVLTVAMLASLSLSCYAAGYSPQSNNFVDEETAYQVAVNFVLGNTVDMIMTDPDGDLAAHGIEYIEEGFPENFIVYEIEPFYDYNEDISAYNVKIQDEFGTPSGYVIVSANTEEYPIIEYSYDGTFYMESVECELLSEENTDATMTDYENKKYYNGNYDYSIKVFDEFYHFSDGEIESFVPIKKDKRAVVYDPNEGNQINGEWVALTSNTTAAPIGSVIVDSDDYESGYSNRAADYCAGMPSSWYLMTDFSTGGVCAPTAATNLCYYWTLRDSTYSNLLNSTWAATFSRIYTLMSTDDTYGTTLANGVSGIRAYFIERGYNSTEAYYYYCSTTDEFNDYIKSEINVGRPMLLWLLGDSYYSNHAVLAVGYVRYMYDGEWSSHYIRIADGWNRSIRYIHYETGRNELVRIRVIPGV